MEGTLSDLPRSEETRELVTKWLQSLEESLAGDKPAADSGSGVTGQKFPPEIFSGGENILRTNSPPGVNSLGIYLPL